MIGFVNNAIKEEKYNRKHSKHNGRFWDIREEIKPKLLRKAYTKWFKPHPNLKRSKPGSPSGAGVISAFNITVENIGTVKVDVDASLAPLTGTVFNYLKLNGVPSPAYCGDWADYIISGLKPSLNQTLTTVLDVPPTYTAQGPEATTLIFEATAA